MNISGNMKTLQELNDIDEECSQFEENYESESSEIENEHEFEIISISSDESEDIETAADGTVWEEMQACSRVGRAPRQNIFREVAGPTAYAKRNIMKGHVKSAFSLIIDRYIMEHIVKCSEAEATRVLETGWKLSRAKLDAFIGLLYARGAYESKNLKIAHLWNKTWGSSFFPRTMSRNDFSQIMRFIRFDNKTERSQRLRTDKFALISDIWDRFVQNSQISYKPGEYITVDEQLFPTKARCRFTQYMPNKPDKFGIKFWLAADVRSKYVVNAYPYLGKDENRCASTPLGEYIVLKLMEPYMGCGRNVTTDNYFTSVSLVSKLLHKRTTLVGTIRANKKELPQLAKIKKDNMTCLSTKLYKSSNCTLTIYKSRRNKKVSVISSMHKSINIETDGKQLPETIQFYNSTKFGVDVADQMARTYSVKSKSRRWPLQVFFNIIDLAGINAWVLYKEATGDKLSRQTFLFKLAEELASEYQQCQNVKESHTSTSHTLSAVRKTCQIGFCNKNKTNKVCSSCAKYVCGGCAIENVILCKKC